MSKCNSDLIPTTRHKLEVNECQSCKGMWLEFRRWSNWKTRSSTSANRRRGP